MDIQYAITERPAARKGYVEYHYVKVVNGVHAISNFARLVKDDASTITGRATIAKFDSFKEARSFVEGI